MTPANEDVVELLLSHHQQIKLLFGQLDKATGEARQRTFEQLVGLLAVHESVEEELVHPMARRELDDGDSVVDARLGEEQEAKRALDELYELGIDHADFGVKLAALRDAVTAHAEAEEAFEFRRLQAVVDPDQLTRMAAAARFAATAAPTRPHPGVPTSAVANLLLGPPLAVFDRVRDGLREAMRQDATNSR